MAKPNKLWRLSASLLALLLLPGCWDRTELNDMAFTLATAVDAAPDNRMIVTVEVPIPAKLGKNAGAGDPYVVVSTEAATMRNATQLQSTRMSRRVSSSHRRVMIIGEELAKKGIRPLFDNFSRVPENRLNGILVIAKGKASELLKGKTPVDEFSWEALREIVRGRGRTVNNMKNVAQALSLNGRDPIVIYMGTMETKENGKNQIQLLGYAQFREDKMIGIYQDGAMNGIHWLNGQITPHEMTVALPSGQFLTVYIFEGSTRIRPTIGSNNKVTFHATVNNTFFILEDFGELDFNDLHNVQLVKKEIGKAIERDMQKCFEQMQKDGTDSVALGSRLFRKYPRIWKERLEADWRDKGLKEAELIVRVESHVSHTGLISDNLAKEEKDVK
ncbi:Ger(x)C family spore germination protein [Gorillibacterium sp. CAU 1737]|uniref:Ger(x)C family spore germination protein n=1 Tax=Gorillibacterium sp. CAU 1737 TaxID=3140362 RepID=UPI003261478C